MRETTRLVRAGLPEPPAKLAPGAPIHPGPVFASAYVHAGRSKQVAYTYHRFHNPTWRTGTCTRRARGRHGANFPFWNGRVMAVFAACSVPAICCFAFRQLLHDPYSDPGIFTDFGIEVRAGTHREQRTGGNPDRRKTTMARDAQQSQDGHL